MNCRVLIVARLDDPFAWIHFVRNVVEVPLACIAIGPRKIPVSLDEQVRPVVAIEIAPGGAPGFREPCHAGRFRNIFELNLRLGSRRNEQE